MTNDCKICGEILIKSGCVRCGSATPENSKESAMLLESAFAEEGFDRDTLELAFDDAEARGSEKHRELIEEAKEWLKANHMSFVGMGLQENTAKELLSKLEKAFPKGGRMTNKESAKKNWRDFSSRAKDLWVKLDDGQYRDVILLEVLENALNEAEARGAEKHRELLEEMKEFFATWLQYSYAEMGMLVEKLTTKLEKAIPKEKND